VQFWRKKRRGKLSKVVLFLHDNAPAHLALATLHWGAFKATNITYSKCVSVALVIQHSMRMRHVISGQPNSTIYSTSFLLLRFCILIVIYASFCIFCFHRTNWHSSATLTEIFPCFSSLVKQIPGYHSQSRSTALTHPIRRSF
jgi:hypothetical protein